jgi:lysophospholipase L1-like esterase
VISDGSGTTTRTFGLRAVALLAMICGLAGCGTMRSSASGPQSVAVPRLAPTPVAQTPVAQSTAAPVVVTLGDSVPAGTACDCDPFPTLYAREVHAVSVNLAVPGYTSSDVLGQIPAVRANLSSAAEVVLMIGANDLAAAFDDGTSYSDAAGAMQQNVVAAIRAIDAIRPTTVLVLGYWNVVEDGQVAAGNYGSGGVQKSDSATQDANDALQAAAKQTGATYISTVAAFHGADGNQDPTALLAPDGDHPNAAGHAAIAALLPPLGTGPAGAEPLNGALARSAAPTPSPTRSGPG